MSDQSVDNVMVIYAEYVKRRQRGSPMEDVIRELQPMADQLTRRERQQLSQFVQTWEGREEKRYSGLKHPASASQTPPGTPQFNTTPANPIRSAPPVIPDPGEKRHDEILPSADPKAVDQTGPAADPDSRQICPNCGKPNHKKDSYCYACGHILISSKPGTKALDANLDPETRWGTANFGHNSTILLQVRGAPKPLEVNPKGELIIGRAAADNTIRPDIDLGPYNAEELGVSRLHAALKRLDNTIAITDLDSKNHTYINGQRLHSHEVRVLRDGDEIRLGKLPITITFKHQIRRIGS